MPFVQYILIKCGTFDGVDMHSEIKQKKKFLKHTFKFCCNYGAQEKTLVSEDLEFLAFSLSCVKVIVS